MHTQNRSDREIGLENIMESMYKAAALEPLSEKHATAKCDHCGGTGNHGDQDCKKCGGDGWIDAKDVVKEDDEVCPKCGKVHTINAGCSKVHEAGASDHVPPHDADKLQRAKERGYDEPSDIDHHNQYMMDQDLLQPLHKAAQNAGAKDLNDWMIQQIKDQGENWVNWFMHEVIGHEDS